MKNTDERRLRDALELIQQDLPKQTPWVGLREVRKSETHREVRDGKPEQNLISHSHGVMVEVLWDGQFGYCATPELKPDALRNAAQRALTQAQAASRYKIFSFSPAQRPPTRMTYQTPVKIPYDKKNPQEINELLIKICAKLNVSSRIIRTQALASTLEWETLFVSSNGAECHQELDQVTTDFAVTAQDGNVIQKRTDGGMRGRSLQGGWEYWVTDQFWEKVEMTAQEVLELVTAEPCPTELTSLVLMPDQMMLQIHESIGHPLEMDRILGDERNYAGWSFVKPGDFGRLQYGSSLMNISFDPSIAHEFASYAFDDNGVKAQKEFLIKDGILLRGLGGIESQLRSGIAGVSNARASSWNRAPIDRMANLNLEPGSSSIEEIIGSVKRGVLMESNRSWSIDDFRNKFQFGCEYAKLIEDGKLTRTLRDPNYRGITNPFWRSLKRVGNESTFGVFGTPNCGKGEPNQVISVGHASPICLFENVEVFGGAK